MRSDKVNSMLAVTSLAAASFHNFGAGIFGNPISKPYGWQKAKSKKAKNKIKIAKKSKKRNRK